jgi:lipopolysaccharide export system permease protein
MQSCGMSFNRLCRPYLLSAALIACLNFALGAYIIPMGNKTRLDFEDQYIKNKKSEFVTNIQLEVDTGVVAYIERYEAATRTGYNFSLDKFKGKQLVAHLTASVIQYQDTARDNRWFVRDYTLRTMDGVKEKMTRGQELDTLIDMSPEDFLLLKGQEQTMTSPQLLRYVEKQKQRGVAGLVEFEIEYHKRIATAFAAFILTIIGLSLSSRKIKGGMGVNLGIGLFLSFAYILLQGVSAAFSSTLGMPPFVAVWLPNVLFSLIALYLYLYKAPR